jgi:serine/threonine-protein kinase
MPFEPGKRVGDYEVVEPLGSGGMGHVYRARNVISNRIEALKVLSPEFSSDKEFTARFLSEIRTLATLSHPNIATLHTAFQSDNQLIMVMEYVEGQTLEQRALLGQLSTPTVVDYISQALSALSYAHGKGVIHRDVKPANLMVNSCDAVKLMDFGIAKSNVNMALTRTSTTVGSFYYMSPEQISGAPLDARSDIYSTGVVLYELLAGRRPFESDSTYGVLDKHIHSAPQPPIQLNPSLPPALNEIILTALAKDPSARFQTADIFRDALKPFLAEAAPADASAFTSIPFPPPPPFPDPPPFQPIPLSSPSPLMQPTTSSSKPLWIATGAIAAVLALFAVAFLVPRMRSHAATVPPQPAASSSQSSAPTPSENTQSTPADSAQSSGANAVSPAPAVQSDLNHSAPHPSQQAPNSQAPLANTAIQQSQTFAPPSPSGPSEAELDQLHERYIQLDARARTVDRAISQIRSQQESQGLGLRNDIETADAKLLSYMQAADQNIQQSRAASAQLYLDKAEIEIQTLEKFLGR